MLESMKAVSFKNADAALGELAVFNHLMKSNMMTELVVGGDLDWGNQELALLNIATRKDTPLLASILTKGLQAITQTERLGIQENWIPTKTVLPIRNFKVALTPDEDAWLKAHPNVRIAFDGNFAPYSSYKATGGFSGYAVDVVRLIAERAGLSYSVLPDGEWKTIYQAAQNREIDVVAEMNPKKSREEWFSFTKPYIFLSSYIFARSNDFRIRTLDDVGKLRVAMVRGYAQNNAILKTFQGVTPVMVDTVLEGLHAIQKNRADIYVGALGIVNHYLNSNDISAIKPVMLWKHNIANNALGVRKDWPELVQILDKALDSITENEWKALRSRWPSLSIPEKTEDALAIPKIEKFDQTGFILQYIALIFALILSVILVIWLVRGRPKELSIRETLFLVSFVFAGLIVAIGTLTTLLLEGESKQSEVEIRKYQSLNLALELKQSSDDLTRFARTFAVTNDPIYEKYFQAILAIRDGKKPHPKNYSRSYWDHVASGIVTLDQDGELYSIEKKMAGLGLSEAESGKLSEAKRESDTLVDLEDVALNAIHGRFRDDEGNFSVEKKPDLEMARQILHGTEYHEAKFKIMKPIDEFFRLLDARTTNELNLLRQKNYAIILAITVLILITIGFSIYVFFLLKRRVISPLNKLELGALLLGDGDYVNAGVKTHHWPE
jgi:ABC-type amino acid transport substrate-binding protein